MKTHTSQNMLSLFGKPVRVFLFCDDTEMTQMFTGLWSENQVRWDVFSNGRLLLDSLFADPPHMVICASKTADMGGIEVVRMIKSENVFRQVCAVLLVDNETFEQGLDWSSVEVEDFLLMPTTSGEIRARLELALRRSTRTLDASPLTRLPGNASIMQHIERHIAKRQSFALAYADLDNFKAFNDKYGFLRGDEVLLMTARIIASSVMNRETPLRFVGHIGGDDFVFILPASYMEDTCKSILEAFEAIVPGFYDDTDREHGGIVSRDKRGNAITSPPLSISIAVVVNNGGMTHYGQLSHAAGQLKSVAKSQQGNCYIIDRRKY